MSDPLHTWYSLRNLEALAEREAILCGEIELRRLTRLRDLLSMDDGSVKASLRFRQRRGWLTVELEYEAALALVCQRCLESMVCRMSERVRLGLLEAQSMEAHLPEGHEPLMLDAGRLSPSELVEDELLVSLPMVPRHARSEDCGSLARDLAGGGPMSCSPSTSH